MRAVGGFHHAHLGGADIHGALLDNHVAGKFGTAVALVERALVGFDLDGLVAVGGERRSRGGQQQGGGEEEGFQQGFCKHGLILI